MKQIEKQLQNLNEWLNKLTNNQPNEKLKGLNDLISALLSIEKDIENYKKIDRLLLETTNYYDYQTLSYKTEKMREKINNTFNNIEIELRKLNNDK